MPQFLIVGQRPNVNNSSNDITFKVSHTEVVASWNNMPMRGEVHRQVVRCCGHPSGNPVTVLLGIVVKHSYKPLGSDHHRLVGLSRSLGLVHMVGSCLEYDRYSVYASQHQACITNHHRLD